MPSGYRGPLGDLDDYFQPGSGGSPCGYAINGVDLNARYAAYAGGDMAAATGYKLAGGADLNTRFMKKSTAAIVNPMSCGDIEEAVVFDPGTAVALLTVRRNGSVDLGNGADGNWYAPNNATIGDSHYVLFTHLGGTAPNGGVATGVWHQLNADRTISLSRSTGGSSLASMRVQIAASAGGAVLTSKDINMIATVEF